MHFLLHRQFNEELKDVFPYIYKLVSEKTVAKEVGPEDIVSEEHGKATCGCGSDCGHCGGKHTMEEIGENCDCCGNKVKAVTKETTSDTTDDAIESAFDELMGQFAEDEKIDRESVTWKELEPM